MERLARNVCESLSQILTYQMAHIFGTSGDIGIASQHAENPRPLNEVESDTTRSGAQPGGPSPAVNQRQSEGIDEDAQDSD